MLHLTVAEQLEPLAARLADVLATLRTTRSSPSGSPCPSPGMRRWLQLELARHLGASAPGGGRRRAANIVSAFPGLLRLAVLEADVPDGRPTPGAPTTSPGPCSRCWPGRGKATTRSSPPVAGCSAGVEQTTPFYAGYKIKPLSDLEAVCSGLGAERGAFLRSLLAHAREGRIWLTLDPQQAADELGEERSRIAAALDWLAGSGARELKPSDVRQRYRILRQTGRRGRRSWTSSSSASRCASGPRSSACACRSRSRCSHGVPHERADPLLRRGAQRAVRPLLVLHRRRGPAAAGCGADPGARVGRLRARARRADRRASGRARALRASRRASSAAS